MIAMSYYGNPESPEVLGLVGKGLCYDSGGYSLKPSTGMETMHTDMGGAGAVIGAISAIAKMRRKVNVTAVVAACENILSAHAYHPAISLIPWQAKPSKSTTPTRRAALRWPTQ